MRMGTWSDPFHDVGVARRLAAILDSDAPVPVPGTDVFHPLVGDDDLHDLMTDAVNFAPGSDSRPMVVEHLHAWMAEGEKRWSKPWLPVAVDIVESAVNRWFERHPEQAAFHSSSPKGF
jgi:hypothetical protein